LDKSALRFSPVTLPVLFVVPVLRISPTAEFSRFCIWMGYRGYGYVNPYYR